MRQNTNDRNSKRKNKKIKLILSRFKIAAV